ncbi:hypothetical protein ACHAPT_010056 [Fusarium lateritium]
MEGLKHIRVEDDAEILNENTNAQDDNGLGGGGGDNPNGGAGSTATASSGTQAPKESESGDSKGDSGDSKDGMPGTNSGGGGGLGGSSGDNADGSTTYVEFPKESYEPVYYTTNKNAEATINYQIAKDIDLKGIFWQTTDEDSIANATFKSNDDMTLTDAFKKVSESQIVLALDSAAVAAYYKKPMELRVDWESGDDKFTGSTRSLYFSVSNETDTALEAEISSEATKETSLETISTATATSSAAATESAASSSGGNGGLSTGAKAGIAVGAVIGGLLIIGALAFFLLRRRRRSKQLGEDYTSQQAYTVDKETHGRATDSPNSPYSDENQVQPVALQNMSHDHDEQTARGTPTPSGVARASTGSRGAPTPQNMSSNVAHLVEDGMTADEIRRLEEEERELDDEIERAARR